MKDEIKETLEYKIDFLTKSLDIGIPTKSRRYFNDIKDYITNLQRKADILEETNATLIQQKYDLERELDDLLEKKDNLQQENERLKDLNILNDRNSHYYKRRYEDYKSRCEKASELLESIYMLDNVTITNNACEKIDNAINTLQNGSDSQ